VELDNYVAKLKQKDAKMKQKETAFRCALNKKREERDNLSQQLEEAKKEIAFLKRSMSSPSCCP
jgi:chromosome segregation ATPase